MNGDYKKRKTVQAVKLNLSLLVQSLLNFIIFYLFIASSTATATATEAPTIGLLPIPISPIIST